MQEKLGKPLVYIVRKRALGDVLWMEPVIRQLALRSRTVVVYTKYCELFANYPFQNVVFKDKLSPLELMLLKLENLLHLPVFFIDLELAYEKQPKIHFLHAYQQKAGLPQTMEYPKLYLSDKELAFQNPGISHYVVLHLESMTDRNYRKVYGVEWGKVVDYLSAKGFTVITIGKEPPGIPGTIHLKTSIRDMIALINKASFFIGIDSGPSHLAAALRIPALIFFGAVNPDLRHFRQLFRGRFLQQYCEYAGCYHESISLTGPSCRLVGDEGIPKCSLHTTEYVLNNIDLLIKDHNI